MMLRGGRLQTFCTKTEVNVFDATAATFLYNSALLCTALPEICVQEL